MTKQKNILLVEDDADIAAIERDYLELGGYAVTIAPDGTTGLDKALHQDFDLLLLDVMLPGVDGFTICKRVRAEKDIPIRIVTARGEDVDKIRGFGFGADDYIEKPFSPSFFSGAVAITAMVLPGISGSSILLIAGVYLPIIQAVHNLMGLQLNVLPDLCALGFGVLAGVGFSISAIRTALQNHRSAMVSLILGLMLGSLYAIANGPASLDVPLPPLSLATVRLPAVAIGVAILLALEGLKKSM